MLNVLVFMAAHWNAWISYQQQSLALPDINQSFDLSLMRRLNASLDLVSKGHFLSADINQMFKTIWLLTTFFSPNSAWKRKYRTSLKGFLCWWGKTVVIVIF